MGVLEYIADSLARIAAVLESLAEDSTPPPQPQPLSVRVTDEFYVQVGDALVDMIKFVLVLPEEATADVVRREITVGFQDGTSRDLVVAGRLAADSEELEAPQDSTITVRTVSVDDAGNHSPARDQSVVIADTIAPPEPGEVGVRIVGESAAP